MKIVKLERIQKLTRLADYSHTQSRYYSLLTAKIHLSSRSSQIGLQWSYLKI